MFRGLFSRRTVAFATAVACLLTVAPAPAQAASPTNRWYKACQETTCLSALDLRSRDTSVLIRVDPRARQPILMVTHLPTDVKVDVGATWQIDGGKQLRVPYMRCTERSCSAQVEINEAYLDALRAAGTFHVGFTTTAGRYVVRNVPLSGFARAFDGSPTLAIDDMSPRFYSTR